MSNERDTAVTIIALERAALDRWGKGDPSGYLEISAPRWFTSIHFWNVAWMVWRHSLGITSPSGEKYGLTAMSSLIRKCRCAVTQPFSRSTLFRILEKHKCAGIALKFFSTGGAVGSSSRLTGQSLSI